MVPIINVKCGCFLHNQAVELENKLLCICNYGYMSVQY